MSAQIPSKEGSVAVLTRPKRSVPRRDYLAMADVKIPENPVKRTSKKKPKASTTLKGRKSSTSKKSPGGRDTIGELHFSSAVVEQKFKKKAGEGRVAYVEEERAKRKIGEGVQARAHVVGTEQRGKRKADPSSQQSNKRQAMTEEVGVKEKVKPSKAIIVIKNSGGEVRRSMRLDKDAIAEEQEREERRREESACNSQRLCQFIQEKKTTDSILAIMPICEPRRKQRKEKHIVRSDFVTQQGDNEMAAKLNFLEAVGICMPQPDSEPDTDLTQVDYEIVAIVRNDVAESLEGEQEESVKVVMESIELDDPEESETESPEEASIEVPKEACVKVKPVKKGPASIEPKKCVVTSVERYLSDDDDTSSVFELDNTDDSEDTMSASDLDYIDDMESIHEEQVRKVKRKEKPVATMYKTLPRSVYNPVETVVDRDQPRVVKKRVLDEKRERKFKCTYCCKAFYKQPHLNTHMIIHTGSRPFECPICSKRFTQLTNLQTHKARIHFGEKRFKCEFCGRRFSELSNVLRHEKRVHSMDREFICNMCQYRFKTKDLLQKHYECKHTEKGFQCRFCKKKFSRKSNMHQHISMAHTEKLYSCKVCSKDFSQRGSMLVHQMAKHCYFNVDEEDDEEHLSDDNT